MAYDESTLTQRGVALLPWSLLTACLALRYCSSEVFLDGVVYATVSRNLALGLGSLWAPFYTAEHAQFWQHPPLAFWVEALVFRVLGDRPWVERVPGTALALLAVAVIGWIHRGAIFGTRERSVSHSEPNPTRRWLPQILLILCPGFTWCASNNMLESFVLVWVVVTTALFVGLSDDDDAQQFWGRCFVGGVGMALALMTKGIAAAFLLLVPLALALEGWSWRKVGRAYAGALLGAAITLTLLTAPDPARAVEFLRSYTQTQLVPSLLGQREGAPFSGYVLVALLTDLVLPMGATAYGVWRCGFVVAPGFRFCLAMALAGSLPFACLTKQMAWCAVPSYPFWVLALSSLVRSTPSPVVRRSWLRGVHVVLLGTTLVCLPRWSSLDTSVEVASRDRVRAWLGRERPDPRQSEYCWHFFRKDVMTHPAVPRDRVVSTHFGTCDFRTVAYAARHLRVTLTPRPMGDLLLAEQVFPRIAPVNCRSMGPPHSRYELFRCHGFDASKAAE